MGVIFSPAVGAALKVPSGVQYVEEGAVGVTVVGHVAVETKPGRSLKIESLLRSLVVVMLKGVPELATMNGLKRKFRGRANELTIKNRLRVSKDARP